MKAVLHLMLGLLLWWPGLAWAEEAVESSYRGIATIYYTLIWAILAYGLLDAFGRKALYVGAPILAIIIYLLLPPA
ncbi:hypothetical protein [Nitrospira moscoviensis]|uniref:Major facilitator superfamily (MFS) profile domain-containing protein n=1 Tax=Nitrospira moscoviensis TaxID=42253 RepID=A0A0K2GCX2_NITMO|nr:hypothetical protein [Nitrospira moscoviensis]ALA58432.1 membrane protein of unknown function [Nitrospira moscoviensis]